MCQGGDWLYASSSFSGSATLPDVIELVHGDTGETMRFSVRARPDK
jgi:hypothetical protein